MADEDKKKDNVIPFKTKGERERLRLKKAKEALLKAAKKLEW
jgi:hypothetical protein